jgi:Holliday junction DNA helicase RuvA
VLEFIRGRVEGVAEDAAVVSMNGVGVRVQMTTADLAKIRGDVTIHTVLQIKDEDVHVYGFSTERGRELFRFLLSVSGVGPKVALAVLSFYAQDVLERAIASGDADALGLVPGVGKKTAGRIVLELRDKLGVVAEPIVAATPANAALTEVREALKGLGYSTQEIQGVLAELPTDGDAPTLLRHALRTLGGREPSPVNN